MSSRSRIPLALFGGTLLGACAATNGASLQPADPQYAAALRQANLVVSAPPPPQQTFTAYITGYSYWDNTPPGSAAVAMPVIHNTAGGQGTYADPVTLAVGYSLKGGREELDVPAGTRFYLEGLRRYAIVEDVCGDGPVPQNGPCHTGHAGHPWFDVYVGGEEVTAQAATACAQRITALQTVIMNPAPDLPVSAGELTRSYC